MNSPLLPREWMDPAKRPPRNYLLNWQLDLLDFHDDDPQMGELVFYPHEGIPGRPRPLRPFQTLYDLPPLPAAWKNPDMRPRDLRNTREVLDKYDRDPYSNIHLFDDWEGLESLPFRENTLSRNRIGKIVGPSAQDPKKVFTDLGRLAGADFPFFRPEIDPPFRTLTRKGLRKDREERKKNESSERREVVLMRNLAEENCRKGRLCTREDQRRKIYRKINSIEKMIGEIKKKLAFTESDSKV